MNWRKCVHGHYRCRANFDCCGLWWKALLCSLNLVRNYLPVCPMYVFPQSGHVSLYTLDCLYLSCSGGDWDKCFHMLLLVRKATLMFVCLNSFVMKVVSLPVYVNVHQYLLLAVECCVCGIRLVWGVWICDVVRVCVECFLLEGWICKWKALLCSMSVWYFLPLGTLLSVGYMYSAGYVEIWQQHICVVSDGWRWMGW